MDSSQTTASQPQTIPNSPLLNNSVPAPTTIEPVKSKSSWKKILVIIVVVFLVGLGFFSYLLFQGVKDSPEVKQKVTSFLQNVSDNNLDTAYSLTSNDFKRATPKEDFVKSMQIFKAQYSGFKEQNQTGFKIVTNAGKPTQYQYTGEITYTDGDTGDLYATLIKENDEWRIYSIVVDIDIKRMEKFQQAQKDSVLGASTQK